MTPTEELLLHSTKGRVLIPLPEAANLASYSIQTFRNAIATAKKTGDRYPVIGGVPLRIRQAGKRWMVDVRDLAAWMDALESPRRRRGRPRKSEKIQQRARAQ
ncbi:MAG TPA: hypothetical protein VK971_04405 [Thiohalobacter sp.]|nr:hypothetical protein [Thiohalobacter sp.]